MWSFIKWAVGVREKEINSINPNSMSPLPSNKFVNYARDIEVNNDD